MATIEQIKALIKMHFENNDDKFRTIALQIAAHEAKIGHPSSARDIKNLVQSPKYEVSRKILKFTGNNEAVERKCSIETFDQLVVADILEENIGRLINEYRKKELLRKNGLKNRSKILCIGDPGTGKTMTATVISNELSLPLYVIQIEKLITKYMGEASVKLKQVFDNIYEIPGVYLFDEFDAIGSDRSLDNDVGEMRRILNSFLQYIENDDSNSIIIAATNNPKILDRALFRRFDDVWKYKIPDQEQITRLIKMKLSDFDLKDILNKKTFEVADGLNHADIVKACEETIKYSILEQTQINQDIFLHYIEDRKALYKYKEA